MQGAVEKPSLLADIRQDGLVGGMIDWVKDRVHLPQAAPATDDKQQASLATVVAAETAFQQGLHSLLSSISGAMAVLQKDAEAYAATLAHEHQRLAAERARLELDRVNFEASKQQVKALFIKEGEMQHHEEHPEVHARSVDVGGSAETVEDARLRGFQLEREALRLSDVQVAPEPPVKPSSFFGPLPPDFLRPLLSEATCGDKLLRPGEDGLGYVMGIGSYCYTVLPLSPVDESRIKHDMCSIEVVVPDTWEVLSTNAQDFDEVIHELCERNWGTTRLCVHDQNGFASYATALKLFGSIGEKLNNATNVFTQDECNPRKFMFNSMRNVSGRIVIRSLAPGQRFHP